MSVSVITTTRPGDSLIMDKHWTTNCGGFATPAAVP